MSARDDIDGSLSKIGIGDLYFVNFETCNVLYTHLPAPRVIS